MVDNWLLTINRQLMGDNWIKTAIDNKLRQLTVDNKLDN